MTIDSRNDCSKGWFCLTLLRTFIVLSYITCLPVSGYAQRPFSTSAILPIATDQVSVGGNGESPEVIFQTGLIQFKNGEFESSLESMKAANAVGSLAGFYEGLSASKLGRFEESAAAFSKISGSADLPHNFLLEYGVALVESGQLEKGVEQLEAYALAVPGDDDGMTQLNIARRRLADQNSTHVKSDHGRVVLEDSHDHDQEISEAEYYLRTHSHEDPRSWDLTILNAIEWDSNVLLSPEFTGLGSGADQNDARHVLAVFGDYRWKQEDDVVAGVTGSVFNSTHFALDEFNTFNASAGVYGNKALGESFMIGTNYQYQHTLVDSSTLAAEHRIVLSGSMLEGDVGHLTTYYEYDRNRILADALIPAQERTANVHAFGLTQAIYLFEGAGRFFVGYRFADNNARGSDFDFRSNMATARLELPIASASPLWTNTIVDAEARVFFDKYENPNSLDFNGRQRDDTRTEIRVGAQRYLTEFVSFRIDYTYTNSDSNVANLFGVRFYDYDRHVVSSQFVYDF